MRRRIHYIKWEPFNSVHVDILDQQHQRLFDLVNDLIDEIELGTYQILPVVHELADLLAVHFEEEHAVMTESNYPEIAAHTAEHQQFTDKIEEFFREYRTGGNEMEYKWITFLKEWVYHHTTRVDRRYGEHLLRNSGNRDNPDK